MRQSLQTPKGMVRAGSAIRINHLDNFDSPINDSHYDGKTGVVTDIDDIGGMHGTWGGLAVYASDDFDIVG